MRIPKDNVSLRADHNTNRFVRRKGKNEEPNSIRTVMDIRKTSDKMKIKYIGDNKNYAETDCSGRRGRSAFHRCPGRQDYRCAVPFRGTPRNAIRHGSFFISRRPDGWRHPGKKKTKIPEIKSGSGIRPCRRRRSRQGRSEDDSRRKYADRFYHDPDAYLSGGTEIRPQHDAG